MNNAIDLLLILVGIVAAIAGEAHVHLDRRDRDQEP